MLYVLLFMSVLGNIYLYHLSRKNYQIPRIPKVAYYIRGDNIGRLEIDGVYNDSYYTPRYTEHVSTPDIYYTYEEAKAILKKRLEKRIKML